MNAQGARRPAPQRDCWIPWLIFAGFVLVVAVNGVMVYFAMSSFTGLQTEHYYQRGLAYNDVLADQRAQQALGWSVGIDFRESGDGRGRLTLLAHDRDGRPLDGAGVSVRLVRPVQDGYDMDVTLAGSGNGQYAAEVELPLRGQWEILAHISHSSGSFRTAKRIVAR